MRDLQQHRTEVTMNISLNASICVRLYPGPDVQDTQSSIYLYIAYDITINVELLNASVLPKLRGGGLVWFFFPSEHDTSGHQTNL